MNCLFVNLHEPVTNQGGIETVTGVLSEEFRLQYNIKTYCLFGKTGRKDASRYPFECSMSMSGLSTAEISALLIKWDINIIIIQAYNEMVPIFGSAIKSLGKDIKLLYVLHSNPGWEFRFSKWKTVKKMPGQQGLRGLIKMLFFPLFRVYSRMIIKHTYRRNYKLCDKIILLSPQYIPEYQKLFDIKDNIKFHSIANPCVFITNNIQNNTSIEHKKKNVLIVSRLLEFQKRISYALKIWQNIEMDSKYNDWSLIIVGYGQDESLYRNYVNDHNLKRVSFMGKQNPKQFYIDSSIFMMTSEFEGLALTIVEAQNFGCVPIAFNSFSSLSDIIDNGATGIAIDNNNYQDFVQNLKILMSDTSYRNRLAKNAIQNVERFSIGHIGQKWIKLFNELDFN